MKPVSSNFKRNSLAVALAAMVAAPAALAGDVTLSGFLSVGGGMVDDKTSQSYNGIDEEDFTFSQNLLGLQVAGKVNDKVTVTAQMISRASSDYKVESEWAYITYQATDNTKIRMGRLRTPLYMYSDYLDVGYAYPWISAPQEVYYLPLNNVDGVDIYSTGTLGSFDTSLQVYFGSFDKNIDLDGVAASASTRNQAGIAVTLSRDWWNLRAAFHQTDLTLNFPGYVIGVDPQTQQPVTFDGFLAGVAASPFAAKAAATAVDGDKATFAEIGLNIDTGRFVAAAEHVEFETKNAFLSKNVREYVMAGVRFGDFLVHVTGSHTADEVVDLSAGIPLSQQTAVLIGTLDAIAASRANERDVLTLGTRWDFSSGTALKLQYDDVKDDLAGDQKVLSVAVQAVF